MGGTLFVKANAQLSITGCNDEYIIGNTKYVFINKNPNVINTRLTVLCKIMSLMINYFVVNSKHYLFMTTNII